MMHEEHVKKALEEAIPFIHSRGYGGVAHIMHDALELLKEQTEVVRCGEYKWRGTYQCPIYVGGDGMCGSPDEWFCATGERRE